MAFQSQSICPNCGGQLKLKYDKIMLVVCEYCGHEFTVDEISRHINELQSSQIEKGDSIYNTEKYDELLTTKNIENLKDDALKKRMQVALLTERYNELSKYIEELRRRDPMDYMSYEFAILAKYKVAKLEDLVDLGVPFYEQRDYEILYKLADSFKREELNEYKRRALEIVEKQRQQEEAERRKAQAAEQRKENAKKGKKVAFILLAFLPIIMVVVTGILLFSNYTQLTFARAFGGALTGWIFFLIASATMTFATLGASASEPDSVGTKICVGVCCGLSALAMIISLINIPKIEPGFNPANQVEIYTTGLTDDSDYYLTTYYFEIENHCRYKFAEIGVEMTFSNSTKQHGTWTVHFKNGDVGFGANSSTKTSVEFNVSNSHSMYYDTYANMTVTYKVYYLKITQNGKTRNFNGEMKTAQKR